MHLKDITWDFIYGRRYCILAYHNLEYFVTYCVATSISLTEDIIT